MVSRFEQKSKQTIIERMKVTTYVSVMAEGSYWSSEFFCPTTAEFLDESVCKNTEDVAGARELPQLVLDGRIPLEPWTINSKAMLPHPLLCLLQCLLGPSSAQELPRGLKDTDRSTNDWARTAA